jgi:hypothetical protein
MFASFCIGFRLLQNIRARRHRDIQMARRAAMLAIAYRERIAQNYQLAI